MSFYYILKYLKKYLIYIIISILVIILLIFHFIFNNKSQELIEEEIITTKDIEDVVEEKELDTTKHIKVDIKGAVNNPGVYELEEETRVSDAISVSGGLREDADTSLINLSKLLKDEMVIIIYTKDEIASMQEGNTTIKYIEKQCVCPSVTNDACIDDNKVTNKVSDNNSSNSSSSNTTSNTTKEINYPISINTASIDELTSLPGIGEAKAKAIVEYRNTNGNFNTIEEITNVSGIGNSTFEKIKEYITV